MFFSNVLCLFCILQAYIEANFGSETQACTGTAISRNFVLSAAHCFRRLRIEQKCMHIVKPGDVTITMGTHFSNEVRLYIFVALHALLILVTGDVGCIIAAAG